MNIQHLAVIEATKGGICPLNSLCKQPELVYSEVVARHVETSMTLQHGSRLSQNSFRLPSQSTCAYRHFLHLFVFAIVHIVKCLQCKIQLEVHLGNTARRSHAKVPLPALMLPCTVKITACI